MMASGRTSPTTRSTSESRVMLRSCRVIALRLPAFDRRSTMAEPSCPAAPSTRKRITPRHRITRPRDTTIPDTIPNMETLDALIVGGGVTGLAAAHELAASGMAVAVAERHARFGLETSTHNSGVIHAGIYYP